MELREFRLPEQREVRGKVFPLCLAGDSDGSSSGCTKEQVLSYLQEHREELDELLRQHKAILFRNCGLRTAEDFDGFVKAMDLEAMDYIGGAAVRSQLTDRVFTANESPSSEKIPFHHEMAQTPDPPTHLFFFCESEPATGGQTPILVSSEICEALKQRHPAFFDSLTTRGVRYIRMLPEDDDPTSAIGRGWKSTFLTTDKATAEDRLRQLGSTWEWMQDGTLRTMTAVIPAIRVDNFDHRRTNETVFFNSVIAAYKGWNDSRNTGERAVVFGDETAREGEQQSSGRLQDVEYFDVEVMEFVSQKMEELCVSFEWRSGDVLLVDNRTAMHSRRPFTGPRRILAAIARDKSR